MKQVILLFTFTFLIAPFSVIYAQEENWDSKIFETGDFTELALKGGYKVFLSQGNKNSVTVKTSNSDVFNYLKVENNQESLRLTIDRKYFNFDRISLYITFKELERIDVEGSVKLKTNGYVEIDNFIINVEGGARVEMNMKASNIEVVGKGGVLFDIAGITETLKVWVSGAGHVNAGDLKAKDVSFRVEGVGTGSVYATDNLNAVIQGIGKIRYQGDPRITKVIEGVGTVSSD